MTKPFKWESELEVICDPVMQPNLKTKNKAIIFINETLVKRKYGDQ